MAPQFHPLSYPFMESIFYPPSYPIIATPLLTCTLNDVLHKSSYSKNTKNVELFIKSLDYSVDDTHLYKEFFPFCDIISYKVMTDKGRSRGYGFVTFSSLTEATTAIREMNGKILGRRPLIRHSIQKQRGTFVFPRTEELEDREQPHNLSWQSAR